MMKQQLTSKQIENMQTHFFEDVHARLQELLKEESKVNTKWIKIYETLKKVKTIHSTPSEQKPVPRPQDIPERDIEDIA